MNAYLQLCLHRRLSDRNEDREVRKDLFLIVAIHFCDASCLSLSGIRLLTCVL